MSRCSLYRSLTIFTDFGGSEIIPEQTPTVPAKVPLAGTFLAPKNLSLKPLGCGRGGHPAQAEEAVRLVSVAGRRDMMLGERAAEVELTEGRVTPNMKTPIAFIQADKFGGVQSTALCACDGLLRGSAVGHGDGEDYCHDNEDCGSYERQQLHERFPPNGKYRP